jgi:ABC-type nitrate/sulfonate/bicarbonate transport system ATPase subunit
VIHLATPDPDVAEQPFRSLALSGLRHEYRGGGESIPTLGGLDLEVRANEFVTVVGPSGCGKSTLFNLAAGLIQPTAGRILVNGSELTGSNPYVAYMFQRPALYDWRTVLDNVIVGQEFLGRSRRAARQEGREGLRKFGLAGFEDRHPWELSGGMLQRVALLRTYLTGRDLLLLDEPFGALDALTRLQMQQFLLDRWQSDERTILFITHDVDEALLLGDRVLVLSPRPAHVMATVDVQFPRPRTAEALLHDPDFVELKSVLLQMLLEPESSSLSRNGIQGTAEAAGSSSRPYDFAPPPGRPDIGD